MCGFAASTKDASECDLAMVSRVLAPRGPDGSGSVVSPGWWALHHRLAIIDPTPRAHQPFQLEDGTIGVYNGEIYNFRRLSSTAAGQFSSDTEVFVRAIAEDVECARNFRGMFAGVVYDPTGGRIISVRDYFGVKPLYVSQERESLSFSSQLRGFIPLKQQKIDAGAVASVLGFGCVTSGTMLEGVTEHDPGSVIEWDPSSGRARAHRHLTPPPRDSLATPADVLRAAVERNLVSDVPVCILLSGGLDSAVVAKMATERGGRTLGFTLATGHNDREVARAGRTAAQYGIDHKIVEFSEEEIASRCEAFFAAHDQPTIDGLNTYLICSAVRDSGFKVALSGLGGDELLGGYAVFKRMLGGRAVSRLPRPMRLLALAAARRAGGWSRASADQLRKEQSWDPVTLYRATRQVYKEEEVRRLTGLAPASRSSPPEDLRYADLVARSGNDEVLALEVTLYLRSMLLRDTDAFSLASGVELRVPLLDEDFAAVCLDRSRTARAVRGKQVLSTWLSDPYLAHVASEKKSGFSLPMDEVLQRPRVSSLLGRSLSPDSALAEIVDVAEARSIVGAGGWARRWALVALNEWLSRNA